MENWTEINISIPTKEVDNAAAICQMVVPYGIYIEDYSDLTTEAPKIAHIDLIDEELLQKDRTIAIIHIYISPDENPLEAISFLETRFIAEKIEYTIGTNEVEEEKWATAWKQFYHPIRLGENILICPSWEECETRKGEIKITLDPGMAFGTGTHTTTKLCLEALETHMKKGDKILDMGCGSGILSIGGILMGAKSAVAVDIDETAVRVCRENAEMNNIGADKYTTLSGDLIKDKKLAETIGVGYDIITANIVADVIIALKSEFAKYLKPQGILLTSGIISERSDDVLAKITAEGFTVLEIHEQAGWVAIIFQNK